MANKRFFDAVQAELGIIPLIGTSASFNPTSNSGNVQSFSLGGWSIVQNGTGALLLNKTNTCYYGVNANSSIYQPFLEFNINIPTNSIIVSANLTLDASVPTTSAFAIKAYLYNYGTLTSSSYIPASSLPVGTLVGTQECLQNQGFLGDIPRTLVFDQIELLRNQLITGTSTVRFILITDEMNLATNLGFESWYLNFYLATTKLNIVYVTAGQAVAALIGAYWGIKVTPQ